MLQIRRWCIRDNLGMIFFFIFLYKIISFDTSLEPSCQDCSNEGLQHTISLKNKKNISELSPNIPSYLPDAVLALVFELTIRLERVRGVFVMRSLIGSGKGPLSIGVGRGGGGGQAPPII